MRYTVFRVLASSGFSSLGFAFSPARTTEGPPKETPTRANCGVRREPSGQRSTPPKRVKPREALKETKSPSPESLQSPSNCGLCPCHGTLRGPGRPSFTSPQTSVAGPPMAPGEDDDIMVRRKKNISSCIIICLIVFHYCAPLFLTCPHPPPSRRARFDSRSQPFSSLS